MSLWDTASAAIDAVFADRSIAYTGAGLTGQSIAAIITDSDTDPMAVMGGEARKTVYEVAQVLLPQEPRNGNHLVDGAATYRVIKVKRRNDIGKWWLYVEVSA